MADVSYTFQGVNNRLDPATLGEITDPRSPSLGALVEAVNVDIGDRGELRVRQGYTASLAGATHSAWATAGGDKAFVVIAGVLRQFYGTTSVPLLVLSSNNPMVYAEVNDVVVFSNGTDIGLIDASGASLFTTPTAQFKRAMPAGHLLTFYNGQLWVARDNVLTHSDAYDIEQCDERIADIPLLGRATMLIPVSDGLWISGGGETAFLKEGDAEYVFTVPYGAIEGTAVVGKAEWFGVDGFSGEVAVWRSERGICLGGAGGAFKNLTEETLALSTGSVGASILRHYQGQIHFISTVQGTESAYNPFVPDDNLAISTTI